MKPANDKINPSENNKAGVKAYFDGEYAKLLSAGKNGWGTSQMYESQENRFRWFLQEVKPPRDINILEIGCGMGNLLEIILRMGFNHLTGMDISKTALRQAGKRLEKEIDFLCVDLTQKAVLPKNQFDLIIDADCVQMISELPRSRMWNNIHSALKAGGYFLTGNNCSPEGSSYFKEFNGRIEYYWPDDKTFADEVINNGFALVFKKVLEKRNRQCDSWNEYIFKKK